MYIYGKNVAKEYLKNHEKIKKVFLMREFDDSEIMAMVSKEQMRVEYQDRRSLDNMVKGLHQGIILEVPDYEYASFEEISSKENAFFVILDHIEDPQNFGAIIRTCEAAKVDAIIIAKDRCVDVNSTVIKTSSGAINNISICKVVNINNTIKKLKENKFWIIGTDMEGTDYKKIDYSGSICLVIGNEGDGLSRLTKENCDFIASIPMKGKVNSLNASVAAGIIIFEAISRR